MELTAVQQDALVELLNIGFGRAASSLSQLTGHRVLLDVPQVTLHSVDEVGEALERLVQGHVASVHQIFSGPVAGDALLILDESGASMLKELLTNEPALPLSIDASAREVITEVGNILLNACLGTFGNLLKVQVSFSVPHLSIENVGALRGVNFPIDLSNLELRKQSQPFQQLLTHQKIIATFWEFDAPKSVAKQLKMDTDFQKINRADLSDFALPKIIDIYLKEKVLTLFYIFVVFVWSLKTFFLTLSRT